MIYAVVHYPNVDTLRIDQYRQLYDPQVNLIGPHITLMFPVPESVGEANIVNHLYTVVSGRRPFPIHLQGLQKSWDGFLFLMVQEGHSGIVELHEEIYTAVCADYQREDLPFVPHLTLGFFPKNINSKAMEEAECLNFDYRCLLDKVNLVKINDQRSEIIWSKEFLLVQDTLAESTKAHKELA